MDYREKLVYDCLKDLERKQKLKLWETRTAICLILSISLWLLRILENRLIKKGYLQKDCYNRIGDREFKIIHKEQSYTFPVLKSHYIWINEEESFPLSHIAIICYINGFVISNRKCNTKPSMMSEILKLNYRETRRVLRILMDRGIIERQERNGFIYHIFASRQIREESQQYLRDLEKRKLEIREETIAKLKKYI